MSVLSSADRLRGDIGHLRSLWDRLLQRQWDREVVSQVHCGVRDLTSTAAAIDFSELGAVAGDLADRLQRLLEGQKLPSEGERAQITGQLKQIEDMLAHRLCLAAIDTGSGPAPLPDTRPLCKVRVLVLEADTRQANILEAHLGHHGYRVQTVATAEALREAVRHEPPDIMLVDAVLPGSETPGIDAVVEARQSTGPNIPVLFLSTHGDLQARLAAVRAGGTGYFVKPLDINQLIKKIDSLTDDADTPYRVLIVEQDALQAAQRTLLLQQAGLVTEELNEPLNIMHVLHEFRPDLILLDGDMPACHGDELAEAIHQEPRFADLPILFLASEAKGERKNTLPGQGKEAFLLKDAADEELIETISNHIKSARALKRHLQYIGDQDLHTGLLNPQAFLSRLPNAIAEFCGSTTAAALLFIEIDHFRAIRDQVGIASVDLLVSDVARFIGQEVRPTEQVARLGDASFVTLLPGASAETALAVSKRLCALIANHVFRAGAQSVPLTVSIGIAPLADTYRTGDDWLSGAVLACDVARDTGGNNCYLHQPACDREIEQEQDARCAQSLKAALASDALRCVYQPIAKLSGNPVEKYEVLVRINDEAGREVLPARFLPVAEQEGLCGEIDRWVTRHTVRMLNEHQRDGRKTVFFVKVSASTLADKTFVAWLAEQLDNALLPSSVLVFEFSESSVISQLDDARELFGTLQRLGCGTAIEHFGTNTGSLRLLNHLPLNYLKIDRSFIHDLPGNPANQERIRKLLEAADSNAISVIASFVEDVASLDILWRCGVQFIQGNFLQEPDSQMNFIFDKVLG